MLQKTELFNEIVCPPFAAMQTEAKHFPRLFCIRLQHKEMVWPPLAGLQTEAKQLKHHWANLCVGTHVFAIDCARARSFHQIRFQLCGFDLQACKSKTDS